MIAFDAALWLSLLIVAVFPPAVDAVVSALVVLAILIGVLA